MLNLYKICSTCKISKDSSEFYKRSLSKDGLSYVCKLCDDKRAKTYREESYNKERLAKGSRKWRTDNKDHVKENKLLYSFKMTLAQYNDLLKAQDYKCANCPKHASELTRALAVDHDRTCCPGRRSCGKCVRGLLCDSCNRGLGLLQDNIDVLEASIKYLKKYKK